MNQLAARNAIQSLQTALENTEAVTTDMREFTNHFFAPGVYLRTLFIPAGHVLVGKIHKEVTINILLKGKISVVTSDGDKILAEASHIFKAPPGQKAGFAITDVWYASIFPNVNDITDVDALEAEHTVETHEALEALQ